MSFSIMYDRIGIKLSNDEVLLLWCIGSSNCTEFNYTTRREVYERSWFSFDGEKPVKTVAQWHKYLVNTCDKWFGDEEDTARKLEESMSGGNKASNHEKFVSFRTTEDKKFGFKGGSERLDTYGSLNYSNGLVNIAPTATLVDYFQKKEDKKISVKRCMFSIENLAWKSDNIVHNEYDEYGLSAEQKGPSLRAKQLFLTK